MSKREKPVTAVLIGAGARGRGAYGAWALNNRDKVQFTAVAEISPARRAGFAREHGIDENNCHESWEQLLTRGKIADACLICTQDQMHTRPALGALDLGYDVLLEKPMATTEEECRALVQASEKANRQLRICHVVRYTGFFSAVRNAIEQGIIGDVININHAENVAFWHFAHGYVRGNWRRADDSSPVILAKTSHDFDLIYWLARSRAIDIQSFGELTHFRSDRAPEGVPERCVDGCPVAHRSLYYAPDLYVTGKNLVRITARAANPVIRWTGKTAIRKPGVIRFLSHFYKPLRTLVDWNIWPATVITETCSMEEKWEAMRSGPYGRCVYRCDNDVPDHQVVNIRFENGITATLTMQGHSYLDGRWLRIDGTRGTLSGEFTYAGERLVYYDHATLTEHLLWKRGISFEQHGGGDAGLMESFIGSLLAEHEGEDGETLTSARSSVESHLMAFAAERSRLENRVVSMDELRKGL